MENEIENESDNQSSNRPWLWKKGQSGNLKGRPKGKTMKEYARELLACQTEKERQEFLHGLPKEVIWKMAEGAPATKEVIEHSGTIITGSLSAEAIKEAERILKEKKTNG